MAGGMHRYRIDILIPGFVRSHFGGLTKFGRRGIGLLESCQRQTERMMNGRLVRRNREGSTQSSFAFVIVAKSLI
jgi:hypothetical protein